MKSATSIVLFCIVQLLLLSPEVRADDWPQWMGPHRDNIWRETGILKSFPDAGPAVLWRAPVAGGYSGPSVANGFVIVTDYITKDDVKVANFERKKFTGIERIVCLDEKQEIKSGLTIIPSSIPSLIRPVLDVRRSLKATTSTRWAPRGISFV